jgi:hypothetical protein
MSSVRQEIAKRVVEYPLDEFTKCVAMCDISLRELIFHFKHTSDFSG